MTDCMAESSVRLTKVLGGGIRHVEDVAVLNGLVGVLAVQHTLEIQGGHGAAAFLFANQEGLADGGVLRRSPGQGERLHDGKPLHRVDRETAGADHVADHVDESGAGDLHGVAGAKLRVVVRSGICAAGIENHRMRGFGVSVMKDIDEAAGIGREALGGGDQIEQAMVVGVGIDAGPGHFAEHAHVLVRRRPSPAPKPADAATCLWQGAPLQWRAPRPFRPCR